MKKTKESIEKKRAKKKSDLEYSEKVKLKKKRFELSKRCDEVLEREYAKAERKSKARLNKKFLEYDRKCKNEIRKLEWKEEREYVKKKKKLNVIEFAMELAQENSRLRDSDAEGRGFCISCDTLKERHEHAGGHDIPRWVRCVCLSTANINLQCHNCNRLMWPFRTTPKWIETAQHYRENLIKKVWEPMVLLLEKKKVAYFQKWYETNWDYGQPIDNKTKKPMDLDKYIEEMLKENDERWKGKNFYNPRKNWKKIWCDYKQSFI